MNKKHRLSTLLLDFWTCFLIPGYTLLFAGSVQWFSTNFSVLAVTGPAHYRGFLVWGLLAGSCFLVLLWQLTRTVVERWLRILLYSITLLAALCLCLGLPLPYVPEFLPGIARLHTLLVLSACVLLMGALLILLLRFVREDRARWWPVLKGWLAIAAVSGVLFVLAGIITTALEVFFTLSATLLIRKMWLRRRVRP